jgi:hypothetical protein
VPRASSRAVAAAGAFTVKAGPTHVEVVGTDPALGMPQRLALMQSDARLTGCTIESCGFDGERFTARLRRPS